MVGSSFRRAVQNGFSPLSLVAARFGFTGYLRFAGARIRAPDPVSSWGIANQIATGEYNYPGLLPSRHERVIDVGANIGLYALWAARRGATVVAYEPSPTTFDYLRGNTRGSKITARQAAIVGQAPPSGQIRLFLHHERSTRNTVLAMEIGSGEPLHDSVDVPAVSLGEALAEGCGLLKIDCEGAEFEMLRATPADALRRADRIILEFHRTAGSPHELLDLLDRAGFSARLLSGAEQSEQFGTIGAERRD